MNWIDVSKLDLDGQYSDSEQIYEKMVGYIMDQLDEDAYFTKKIYRFMIKKDVISGNQICQILLEQDVVEISEEIRICLKGEGYPLTIS